MGYHVVVESTAELGAVPAVLPGQALLALALNAHGIHLPFNGRAFGGLVKHQLPGLVHAVHLCDFPVALRDLPYLRAAHVVQVKVAKTVLFAAAEKLFAVLEEEEIVHQVFIEIVLVGFAEEERGFAAAGIRQQEAKVVLMTVQVIDAQFLRVGGPFDARDVGIRFGPGFYLPVFPAFHIVDKNLYDGIGFAHFGVLESFILGVEFIAIVGHGKFPHGAFVEAKEGDAAPVGRPLIPLGQGKFFLVHPIGSAVDDGIHTAVFGDLDDFAGSQILVVEVVAMYKSHRRALRIEFGVHDFSQPENGCQFLGIAIVHRSFGTERIAVDAFDFIGDEDFLLIRAEFVALDGAGKTGLAAQNGYIEYGLHHVAGADVILVDLALFEAGEVAAVFQKIEAGKGAGVESAALPNVFKGDVLLGNSCRGKNSQAKSNKRETLHMCGFLRAKVSVLCRLPGEFYTGHRAGMASAGFRRFFPGRCKG